SEAEVWMQVSIQLDGYADFLTISDSRMLSVPYAFHAATAGELIGQPGGGRGSSTSDPMLSWLVIGNKALKPDAKLGTLDNMDVVVVTNNLRSEEHTSELQSRENLVCRLLLEKKKKNVP